MHSESWLLLRNIEVDGPQMPKGFDAFYKAQLNNHVLQVYVHLLEGIKSVDDQEKHPKLAFSSKRIVYRSSTYLIVLSFYFIVFNVYAH
eukprot:c16261_g1_i1 orf=77-343(+)